MARAVRDLTVARLRASAWAVESLPVLVALAEGDVNRCQNRTPKTPSPAPASTGQASPQPIVMTMSAACTTSLVSGLGNTTAMSTPASVSTCTTTGSTSAAGRVPAEETVTWPPARCTSRAAAIPFSVPHVHDPPTTRVLPGKETSGVGTVCPSHEPAGHSGPRRRRLRRGRARSGGASRVSSPRCRRGWCRGRPSRRHCGMSGR